MKKFLLLLVGLGTLFPLQGVEKSFEIVFWQGIGNGEPATLNTKATEIVVEECTSLVKGTISKVDDYPVNYGSEGGLLLLGDDNKEGWIMFNVKHADATPLIISRIGLKCARMKENVYTNAIIQVGFTLNGFEYYLPNSSNLPEFSSADEMEEIEIEMIDDEPIDYNDVSSIIFRGGVEGNDISSSNLSSAYVKSIVFYYNDGQKESADVSFAENEYVVSLYGFDPATSPKAVTTPEGLAVTYTIEDETIATIDAATGELTPLKEGVTTVTASFSGNDDYEAAEAIYTLKVTDTRTLPVLSYSSEAASYKLGYSGQELPTLNNPENLEVSYTSSNEEVADVDATGAVTPKAAGTAVITATFEGNDVFMGTVASFTLTVEIPEYPEIQIGGEIIAAETYYIAPNQEIVVKLVHPGTVYHKFEPDVDPVMPFAPQKAPQEGYEVHDQQEGCTVSDAGTLSYYAEHEGTTFPVKSLQFVQTTDGLEIIGADQREVKILDLQGRPVRRPVAGTVVVIVTDGKAGKAVIR